MLNSHYIRVIKALGEDWHPARFPLGLPAFFINFLTEPGALVVDIFSGSNTTGIVAEALGRNWLSIEVDRKYAALSSVRFLEGKDEDTIRRMLKAIGEGGAEAIDPAVFPELNGNGKRENPEQPAKTKRKRRLATSTPVLDRMFHSNRMTAANVPPLPDEIRLHRAAEWLLQE